MDSEYCLLKEKVQRLEEALQSLGDEMQEKINLILEYFSSSREDQFVAHKKVCDKEMSMLNELRAKCERGPSHPSEATSNNIRRVCLSQPPPLVIPNRICDQTKIPQTRDLMQKRLMTYENNKVASLASSQSDFVRMTSEQPIVSTISSAMNCFPVAVPTHAFAESDLTQPTTDTESTTGSQNQFDSEYSSADSLMTGTHFHEYVPVPGNANELQYENIDICSIKIEPEFIADTTDMKSGDTNDCSHFLNGMLNSEEPDFEYGIVENNQLEIMPTSDSTGNESSIGSHRRSRGDGTRFQCALCPKYYKAANNLRIHLRTHTGERPFKCPECQVSFADPSNLRKHIKKGYHITRNRHRLNKRAGLRSLLGGEDELPSHGDDDDRSSSEI